MAHYNLLATPSAPLPQSGFTSDEYLDTHRNNKDLFHIIVTFKKL
jgi:hypothetical protein